MRVILGIIMGASKGDTRSLDYSSYVSKTCTRVTSIKAPDAVIIIGYMDL